MRAKVRVAEKETGGLMRIWTVGAMALMLAVALLLASCGEEEGAAEEPAAEEQAAATSGAEAESEGPAAGVVISDITDNPQEYFGTTATVSGEVNDVLTPNAFTIGGEDFLGTDELLIVGVQQLPNIVEGVEGEVEVGQDDIVQVTGTVREFNVTEIEDEVGYALDDGVFGEFEGEPVVVAKKIFLTPRAERAGEQGVGADISDITDNPEEFFGQTLTVEGIVGETIEANAFLLLDQETAGEGNAAEEDALAADRAILVVNSDSFDPKLSEGQSVRVKGTLQEFDVAAFEEELGIELENDTFADFAGRPAMLAQQIKSQ